MKWNKNYSNLASYIIHWCRILDPKIGNNNNTEDMLFKIILDSKVMHIAHNR